MSFQFFNSPVSGSGSLNSLPIGLVLAQAQINSRRLGFLSEEEKKRSESGDFIHYVATRDYRRVEHFLEQHDFKELLKNQTRSGNIFHYAVISGDLAIVQLLVNFARSSLKLREFSDLLIAENFAGNTPLDLASRHGHAEIFDFLNSMLHPRHFEPYLGIAISRPVAVAVKNFEFSDADIERSSAIAPKAERGIEEVVLA